MHKVDPIFIAVVDPNHPDYHESTEGSSVSALSTKNKPKMNRLSFCQPLVWLRLRK